eukprot:4857066-Alexandrium_andersonii.AAC.1
MFRCIVLSFTFATVVVVSPLPSSSGATAPERSCILLVVDFLPGESRTKTPQLLRGGLCRWQVGRQLGTSGVA